jgi:3-methylcrotonyl-CoA carboxylase beta subunit
MPTIATHIDPRSADFQENARALRTLTGDLESRLAQVALGGGEKARRKHTDRGKLLPRERIRALLDPGSPFLEFSPLAAHGMYEDAAPCAGIITGIGRVHGQEILVVANYGKVNAGSDVKVTV